MAHLRGAGDHARIFELLEEKPYLAQQAEHFGGFRQSGDDLETVALPAVIECGDWVRFLHYAALAVNLRGLAEALAEPEILTALAREQPTSKLAQNSLAAIVDPARRAQARAALAGTGSIDPNAQLIREIEEDLGAIAVSERSDRVEALRGVARNLRADLSTIWPQWIERWASSPGERSAIWQAVAEGLLACDVPPDGVWKALAEIGDPNVVLDLAPNRLGSLPGTHQADALERLQALFSGKDLRWLAAVRFLESHAQSQLAAALSLWERIAAGQLVPWSATLLDAGRTLLGQLPQDRVETLDASLPDVEAQAALRVIALAAQPGPERAAAALHAVGLLPPGATRLHWSLRYLEARPPEPGEEVERQVRAVLWYLNKIRYEAAAGDVRRALDLTARHLKTELSRQIENAVWSPNTSPDTLRTLAAEAETELVLSHLLDHAERYAAGVSPTEADGFQLRSELILRLTCRLCRLRGDLRWLQIGAERLLPDEEDDLRVALARELPRSSPLVAQVCAGIGKGRQKLLASLSSVPPENRPDDLLSMPSLYQSLADVHRIEDERLALTALLEAPDAPRDLIQQSIARMEDRDEQIPALLRFARHALAFETAAHPQRPDRLAVIEMVRDLLAVSTDIRLAALTPDIAALGSQVGGARAVSEHQEAARRLLGLETVPWPSRLASLERMLAALEETFSTLGESPRRTARRIAEVLAGIARLPVQLEKPTARAEARLQWHEVLPIVIAAADRLPARETLSLDRSLRMGLAAIPAAAANGLDLCLLEREARVQEIDSFLAGSAPPPDRLHLCLYLLAGAAPGRVQETVRLLPADGDRDARIFRLIRHGWLPAEISEALLGDIGDPDLALAARVWIRGKAQESQRTEGDPKSWIDDLAALAARRDIDPSNLSFGPLVCRVWTDDASLSRPALALTVIEALRSSGRPRGENALRLWLHAELAPRMGSGQAEKLARSGILAKALQKARSLTSAAEGVK